MLFVESGVEVSIWVPPLVAFVVSFFTSMGGVSGAFLLLPFQVSILGFVSPAVSPTNMVYNVIAIPAGIYRFLQEGRMAWPLTWLVVIGTLPGVGIGAILRIRYLLDPRAFKFFVGLVLLYIGVRLAIDLAGKTGRSKGRSAEEDFLQRLRATRREEGKRGRRDAGADLQVRTKVFSLSRLSYEFCGQIFDCPTWGVLTLSFLVGIIGGAYGIGGGAIIAPFLVAIFKLPVYTVAGAALAGTFVTSVFGVAFYQVIAPYFNAAGLSVAPDWLLGALFGLGGLGGIYCGARIQKYIPARFIKGVLALIVLTVAVRYVIQFWWH